MYDDQNIHDKVEHSKDIGVIGPSFNPLDEFCKAADAEESVESKVRAIHTIWNVKDVCGENAENVEHHGRGTNVSQGDLSRISF